MARPGPKPGAVIPGSAYYGRKGARRSPWRFGFGTPLSERSMGSLEKAQRDLARDLVADAKRRLEE